MDTTTHTVRLSCACDLCRTNAEHLGRPLPLVAYITEAAASILKITEKNANRPSAVHGTVYMAHHPVIGKAQKMALAADA